jgi:DHA2 family multidrug resistance protein
MSHYTLDTSPSGILGALIVQGVGFSCLWVPLTTVALAAIPRHKLSDATGLNSLVRQIGGSVGLAGLATLMPRFVAAARGGIAAHLVPGRPEVIARMGALEQLLAGRGGLDGASAHAAAQRLLGYIVARQATMLTFEKMFLMAGILFLVILPLLVFLKAPEAEAAQKVDAHVEM